MNVVVGLIVSGLFIWASVIVMKRCVLVPDAPASEDEAQEWSMRRSDPGAAEPVAPPEVAHKLPAHLLEGCPPDPCPEVLYEHLTATSPITWQEVTRQRRGFATKCCGSTRIITHNGVAVCSACDELGFPEES